LVRAVWAPPAALVFDLDGTLVDSGRDIAAAVNLTRRDLGLSELPIPEIVALIGEGARVLIQRALPAGWSETAIDAAFERLLEHYDRTCIDTTAAYPGIPAVLERLARRYPLGLLTNKPERMTRRILEHLDLARFFSLVVGGDSGPTRKPDPSGLLGIARDLGAGIAEVMLVGDSGVDAATARAAGSRLALVGWGYGDGRDRWAEIRARSAADLVTALAAD
jgi:phosphoglycolate phosphatase